MASSKETYCLCGQPYNIGQFMIECDCCREWFHGSCVDVKIYQSDDIDKYHCPKCVQTYGPSVLKIPTNNHRADRYEVGAEGRPAQCGSPEWVRAIQARPLRPTPASLMRMKGHQFTEEFIRDNGFTRPVLFHSQEGLDMKTPNPATFTVRSVLRYCGAQLDVEVIDVRRQATVRMPLGDLVEYLERPPEGRAEKVLNVLSLEFSESGLSAVVEAPRIARSLDWATRVWPPAEERPPRPSVSRYCLMSAAGSYTDFHVDFGGTTVWYHVLHGRKLFYLVPPTAANLALYQQWCASNNQTENFFGDMVEWYGTAELCAGQTLFIPTGWIHAVLTPVDSLVFGGNFLHSYAIEMQLQIYEIERRVETPVLLRYPLFEAMNWYAGAHLLTMLRRHNEETQDEEFTLSERSRPALGAPLPALLLRGLKLLAAALKEWHALKPTDPAKRDNVPKCLNSGQLVRELSKELRTLEKRSTSLANKDKDFKIKNNTSPTKAQRKQQNVQKKSLKLTLPKPIMHMGNGEFAEEKVYADKLFIDNKEVIFQDGGRYVALPDAKYVTEKEVLPEKYTYQTYEEPIQGYQDTNGYLDKKTLKIKLNNSPSHRDEPPPYSLPEHSILKSHLIRNSAPLKPIQQWTISKGDYQEQILFTNENMPANVRMDTTDIQYGAGMYSAEDIQPEYQYSETKPQYQPEYGYSGVAQDVVTYVDGYQRYEEVPVATNLHQNSNYEEQLNGGYSHDHLPSYDAAIAQQYHTTNYVVEETKAVVEVAAEPASSPVAVRRSERPVRRRVSNTYDYEDGDLYIDETPAPRRRRHAAKTRHAPPQAPHAPHYRHTAPPAAAAAPASNSGYRRPAPVNGIESLIQASVIADEEPTRDTEDAAVAGMLSIGEQRYSAPQRTFGLAQDTHKGNNSSTPGSSSKRTRKSTAAASSADEDLDEEDVIKEVHRDEEYVYPSLEMSSDDDEEWSASRRRRNSRNKVDAKTKGEKDESWSPRARLGRLVPRLRGPARAGVRRECVRAALHAAAHHSAHPAHPPHPAHVPHKAHEQSAKRAVLATKSKRPPPPQHSPSSSKNSRLKKGMKTAKQRLGKILKIHKMIY